MGKTIRRVNITLELIKKPTKEQLHKGIKPVGDMTLVRNVVATGDDPLLIQWDEQILMRAMRNMHVTKKMKVEDINKKKHQYRIANVEIIEGGELGETVK